MKPESEKGCLALGRNAHGTLEDVHLLETRTFTSSRPGLSIQLDTGSVNRNRRIIWLLHVNQLIITACKRSLGQGNIFSGVCLSTGVGLCLHGGRWVCLRGGQHQGGSASGGFCIQGGCIRGLSLGGLPWGGGRQTPRNQIGVWYASYWNAVLYEEMKNIYATSGSRSWVGAKT